MSMISTQLPYVLFSLPFIIAALVLVNARMNARREEHTADYERFIWPEQPEEPEMDDRPVSRRYLSYSS